MMRHLPRLALRRWLFGVISLTVLLSPAVARAQEVQRQKKVLVIYSTGREAAVSQTGERELPRILGQGLESLDYNSEYLDAGRFSDSDYQVGFRDFLRLKYEGQEFDVVIAVHDVAIAFVEQYRPALFPTTPIVFLARRPLPGRMSNSTGVLAEVELDQTIRLAMTLQPDLEQVFVVSGAASRDRAIEELARDQLRQFEGLLTFTYLAGLPTDELERRLSNLPERSIVYYLLVYRDGSGEIFQPVDYLSRIAPFTNRPIYSWVDTTIGHGVVGGSLQTQDSELRATARLALRVLNGEPAGRIPMSAIHMKSDIIDWRELRRWGINEANVPDGTVVRFREGSVWQRYRAYILGAGVLFAAQTALIMGLLAQAARRRRAEEQVNRKQAELRSSYERISDLGGRLLVSQEAERSRIARELHDDFSQQMAVLAADLKVLTGMGPEWNKDAEKLAHDALERARGIARSVRDLSHRLHPASLRLVGLVAALEGLRKELSNGEVSLTFTHRHVVADLPDDLALGLFRVVQEGLQNAIKHSGARNVNVDVVGTDDRLTLTIADDGKGFDVESACGQGLGLMSMRERMELIGGTLAIISTPGVGTRLEATAPVTRTSQTQRIAV